MSISDDSEVSRPIFVNNYVASDSCEMVMDAREVKGEYLCRLK
jgi:hypothetical protein